MLLLCSILLCTHPTLATLFLVLSKQSVLVLSFEYLTDNSNMFSDFLKLFKVLDMDDSFLISRSM
jgi:hypothetical protein